MMSKQLFFTSRLYIRITNNYFKSNSISRNSSNIPHQLSIRNNDITHKSPLLVLFGWGNAKMEHLVKYSEILECKNFTVLCVRTTLLNSLFRIENAKKEGLAVRKVIDDLCVNYPERPIILYTFSNGGCCIYHFFVENMDSLTYPGRNIKGVMFDSCPVTPSVESAVRVHKAFALQMNSPFLEYVSWPLVKLSVYIMLNYNKNVQDFMNILENSKLMCPQLFLFSKKDELAGYEDILDFIKIRQTNGVDISYKLWTDSSHVGHMRKYESEYVKIVESFVEKCLGKE